MCECQDQGLFVVTSAVFGDYYTEETTFTIVQSAGINAVVYKNMFRLAGQYNFAAWQWHEESERWELIDLRDQVIFGYITIQEYDMGEQLSVESASRIVGEIREREDWLNGVGKGG